MNYDKIGLDRIVICKIILLNITIEESLKLHNKAIIHDGKIVGVFKVEGGELKIKIALPLLFYIHNGYNISREEEHKQVMEIIEKSVGDLGVKICLKNAELSLLEVNKNYKLDTDPTDFMNLLIRAQQQHTKPFVVYNSNEVKKLKLHEFKSGAETVTFRVARKYMFKAYLKSLQLRESGVYVEDDSLRMELVIYAEMIKYYFGDNKLQTVLDNIDKLEQLYQDLMKKYMYDRIEEYLEDLNNEIKDKIKDGETPSKIVSIFRHCLCDTEILKRAYKEYYKEIGSKNSYTQVVKRATKKECLNNNTLELFQCLKDI